MINFLMDNWLILATAASSILLIGIVLKRAREKMPRMEEPGSGFRVSVDDRGLSMSHGDHEVRAVKWSDVDIVKLRTTADGPFAEDVFWELELNDGSEPLTIPNGANGVDSILQVAPRHLPDFDHEAVIEAMTSVEAETFLVWERG